MINHNANEMPTQKLHDLKKSRKGKGKEHENKFTNCLIGVIGYVPQTRYV